MNQQNPTLKKAMLQALEKSLTVVTTACKTVGIDRSTHYDWLLRDEDYKTAVEALEDVTIDFAESQLHKQIKDGNTSATIFLLKCKGKKRGYIEKQEIEHTGKLEVENHNIDYGALTPEEAQRRFMDAINK